MNLNSNSFILVCLFLIVTGNSTSDTFDFLKARKRKKTLIQITIGSLVLVTLIYVFLNFYSENKLQTLEIERKFRLDGTGESWVLPHRYEEESALVELEECKRVMLFKFSE